MRISTYGFPLFHFRPICLHARVTSRVVIRRHSGMIWEYRITVCQNATRIEFQKSKPGIGLFWFKEGSNQIHSNSNLQTYKSLEAGGIFPVCEKCLAMEEPASDCWQLFSFAFNFRSSFLERLALPVGACCVPRLCPFWPESDGDVDLVEWCGVSKISVQLGSMVNWWILHGLWFCSYTVYTTCV